MQEQNESRVLAVDRLDRAREQRTKSSEQFESARGSSKELPAFAELEAAEEQFAAREAWLEWIDRDY
jgi:hypothetical protein